MEKKKMMLDDFIALIPKEDLERINQQIDKLIEQENKLNDMSNTTHWMEDDYDVCTICNSISMNGLCDTKGCAYYGGDEEDGLTLDELTIKDLYHEKQQHAINFIKWIGGSYSFGNIAGKWYSHENTDNEYTEEELYKLYLKEQYGND